MSDAGTVLAARYTLQREAWRTDRGQVWHARDATLDRAVFVLVLDPRIAEDRAERRAFVDEAAARAAHTHPSLAAVYDIGTDPPFVVFENPTGGMLIDRLRHGKLDPSFAARIASNIARALQSLHERGEPSIGVSPRTVLLAPDGRAKLVSIGRTDRPVGYGDPALTPIEADRVALAALTVEMFTGHPPEDGRFSRRDLHGELAQVVRGLLDGSADVDLEDLVSACASLSRGGPPKVARRERRTGVGVPATRRADLGWLFGVVVIVALAVVAVILGPRLIENARDRTPGPTGISTSTLPAGDDLLEAACASDPDTCASDFDPAGNGEEHPDQVGRVLDGDLLTAWGTVGYAQPTMGKPGVGLLFDLGEERALTSVRVQTSLPGWEAEIRIGTEKPTLAADLSVAATFVAGTDNTVALPAGSTARFVLVWITELVDDGGGSEFPNRASVAEFAIFG